jgi:translation initiation factor IF-2
MRIHQLAKELDVKAKDIFPHLKKLGIEFKNHMSAISDDDVARVKNAISPPTAENVVEQRIQPTIIRRRRKAEEEPPPEVEEAPQEEVAEGTLPRNQSATGKS